MNAIEHLGARPNFIDIDMNDYCMDANKLEENLKKINIKIKSAIVTDYGGQPQIGKIFKIKEKIRYKINQ